MDRHVAIDARMVRHSGIGTYLRSLVPRVIASRPGWRFTIIGPVDDLRGLGWDRPSHVRLVHGAMPLYSAREQLVLPRLIPADADLYWTPHYVIPVFSRRSLLVTVQDVFHLAVPELVGGWLRRLYARGMFAAVRRRAARVLVTSDFTRREFARLVGHAKQPLDVVPLGVGDAWRGAPRGESPLATPYLLFVGNVKPHKNVRRLINAFQRVAHEIPHRLVIVGRTEGMRTGDDSVRALAAASSGRVTLAGEVSDDELMRWVAYADAFVFPSLYEGFGLPPLEAMAMGCPCLVSRAASLPEVCGDAVLYCDPRDESDIAGGIVRILTDEPLRIRLRAAGLARAAEFTWERCAQGTVAVMEAAMAA